jgi:hypothetical protein
MLRIQEGAQQDYYKRPADEEQRPDTKTPYRASRWKPNPWQRVGV